MKEFKNRLQKNNQYYDLFFNGVKSRTENRDYTYLLERFLQLKPQGTCIVDIGCGSGEHLLYFQRENHSCYGIAPSILLREYCQGRGLKVMDGSFETIKETITNLPNEKAHYGAKLPL